VPRVVVSPNNRIGPNTITVMGDHDPLFVALSDCGFPGWDTFPKVDDPERFTKMDDWFVTTREACVRAAASFANDGSIAGPMWTEVGERLLWNYALAMCWPIAAAFEDYMAVLLDEMKSHDVSRFAHRSR
jgi:hypothetical protein